MSFSPNFTCPLCAGVYDETTDSFMVLMGAQVCEDCGTVYKKLERRGDATSVALVSQARAKLEDAAEMRDQYTIYAETNWT